MGSPLRFTRKQLGRNDTIHSTTLKLNKNEFYVAANQLCRRKQARIVNPGSSIIIVTSHEAKIYTHERREPRTDKTKQCMINLIILLAMTSNYYTMAHTGLLCLHVIASQNVHWLVARWSGGRWPISNMFNIGRWLPNIVTFAERQTQANLVVVV